MASSTIIIVMNIVIVMNIPIPEVLTGVVVNGEVVKKVCKV